jgi:hypothetical protein
MIAIMISIAIMIWVVVWAGSRSTSPAPGRGPAGSQAPIAPTSRSQDRAASRVMPVSRLAPVHASERERGIHPTNLRADGLRAAGDDRLGGGEAVLDLEDRRVELVDGVVRQDPRPVRACSLGIVSKERGRGGVSCARRDRVHVSES